ncbi:unnamed protein product, partial [Aphanomyces euteiches]
DVAEAVDPITLFTLVSTAQALISAGITDPYEFYQYAHVLVTHFGHVDALAIATDPEFLYDHDMMDQNRTIASGVVPGHENNDNTAPELRKNDLLVYPNRSIRTDGIKAALLKSFGFGKLSLKFY